MFCVVLAIPGCPAAIWLLKKGNHPPLKIVVSHNDKRGAFSPEVTRLMFDAMGFAPAVQLDLIFLEALCM
jgi:hypothetical protein